MSAHTSISAHMPAHIPMYLSAHVTVHVSIPAWVLTGRRDFADFSILVTITTQ